MFVEKTFALLGRIIDDIEKRTGYLFSSAEILQVFVHTERKISIIEKDADYFPILFESELCDYLMRDCINLKSEENRRLRNGTLTVTA